MDRPRHGCFIDAARFGSISLVFGSRPFDNGKRTAAELKSSPMIFQNSNRRQTLANQGCRSRGTPAGR